jgi:dolichol kinase
MFVGTSRLLIIEDIKTWLDQMAGFKTEIRRKYIHLIGLTVPVLYWTTNYIIPSFSKQITLGFITFFLLLFTGFEFYRLSHGIPKEAYAIVKPMIRPQEMRGIGGHVYFAAGAFIAVLAYSRDVAIAALLISVFADGGAAVFGSRWGRHKLIGKKTLEGSLALFLIALAFAAWIVKPLMAAFIGAIAATCVELIPINDNLMVPISSGLAMQLVRYFI